jgi:hypothetical protein
MVWNSDRYAKPNKYCVRHRRSHAYDDYNGIWNSLWIWYRLCYQWADANGDWIWIWVFNGNRDAFLDNNRVWNLDRYPDRNTLWNTL